MDNSRKDFNQTKIAQLNTNHSPAATTAFLNYCNNKNIDIALISEPPTKQTLPNIPKRLCPIFIAPTNNNQRVRACMCILNPKLQPIIISHLSTPDFLVCDFNNFILVSVYAHPVDSINPILNNITNTVNYANGRDLIIAGDMNANNKYWGASYNDNHGDEFLAAVIQNNLDIVNDSNTPTFDTIRGDRRLTSHIDLTVASMSIIDRITNWQVIEDVQMSDHRVIVFIVNKHVDLPKVSPSTVRWNTSVVDWNEWARCLENYFNDYDLNETYINNIDYSGDLDATVNIFVSSIRWACEENLVRYNRNRKRKLPWMKDDELEKLGVEQKKMYRKINRCYNHDRKLVLIQDYQKLRSDYRKRVETLKEIHLRKEIFGDNNDDHYQRMCRLLKHEKIVPARTFSNSTGPQDTVDTLLNDLFPNDMADNDTSQQANIRSMVDEWKHDHENIRYGYQQVSTLELLNIIGKTKNNKAPGYDNFSPIICKKVMAFFPDILVAIMNACLRLSHFPYIWKISVVKIIPKPGRPTYDKSNSYRPIGLLPILSKALEAIMANRIKNHMEANCPLSKYQYGFMHRRSTEHALLELKSKIESKLNEKELVALVSLDIKGAFNNAWPPGIIKKLIDMDLPEYLIKLMINYMKDRRVVTNYSGITGFKPTNKGTVQGSILGPLIWNIVIDGFLQKDFSGIHVQAYADDITAVVAKKKPDDLAASIKELLVMAIEWCNENKLTLASDKTTIVPMSRKIRPTPIPIININGHDIAYSNETKVLGVIFDRKIDFRSHVRLAIDKCTRIYRQIIGFARSKYGLGPKIIKQLYNSIIVPIITYGCAAWHRAINYVFIQKELRQFQRPIAQLITKSYRSAAFVSTTAIADMLPLHLEIMKQANIALARIKKKYKMNENRLVVDVPDETRIDVNAYPRIYCGQPFTRTFYQMYTKSIRTRHGIGCGFQLFNGTYFIGTVTYRLPTYCSNLQADLFVISKAIDFCKEKYSNEAAITILNNNLGAISHIKKKNHSKVSNLAKQIIESTPTNMDIAWVKMDRSDRKLVKLKKMLMSTARLKQTFDYEKIPMATIKKMEMKTALINWNRYYHRDKFGTTIKKLCPNVGDARKFWPFNNFWLTQTLTGHGQFGEFLKRFGFIDDAKCPCGNQNQSVLHMLNECPLSERLRRDHLLTQQSAMKPIDRIRATAVLYEQIAMLVDIYRKNLHSGNNRQSITTTDNDHG